MRLAKERPTLGHRRTSGGDEPCKENPCPCDIPLESHLNAAVKGDGLGGSDRARVADEIHGVAGKLRIRRLVKKRAIGRVVIIEEIVDEAKYLHIVGDLIRGVEIGHPNT